VTNHASFPSGRPFLALDRIGCRPPNLMIRSDVVKTARIASDHLPLVANLSLPVTEAESTGFERSSA
jgi:endonuclease/exonuclease/phosphatase family metal-dependent hydrolase